MSQTHSPSSARCYGLARVARVWTVARASVYHSLKETPPNTIARSPVRLHPHDLSGSKLDRMFAET